MLPKSLINLKNLSVPPLKGKLPFSFELLFLFVLFSAAFIFVSSIEHREAKLQKQNFLSRAHILGAAIDIDKVKQLTGQEIDKTNPAYLRLREQFTRIIQSDPLSKFGYLMGMKDGNVIFLVENKSLNLEDESTIGEIYAEATPELKALFKGGEGFVEGPSQDRWGTWVSALVPLRDQKTKKVLAVMGLDVDFLVWKKDLARQRSFLLTVTICFFILIFIILYFTRRQQIFLRKLRAVEKRFLQVTDSSGDWIWETDPWGLYTYSNHAIKDILGYSVEEVIGKKYFYDFSFPEENKTLKEKAKKQVQENRLFIHEIGRRKHKDGREVILDIKGYAFQNAHGKIIGYRGIDRDITEKRRAEETIRKERNFASAVIDIIGALIVVLDMEGRIVRFNRTCEWLTGYTFDEVKGKYIWDFLIIPEEIDKVKEIFKRLKELERSSEAENYWLTKDKEKRLIMWSNTTLVNEFVIATGIDITRQRNAENLLKENRLALEKANLELAANEQLLQETISSLKRTNQELMETQNKLIQSEKIASLGIVSSGIAHEIKNPLSIILQSIERIEKGFAKAGVDANPNVARVKNAAERANRVIDSLLMFSHQSELKMAPLDIHKAIDTAITLIEDKAKQNNVVIQRQYAHPFESIYGDNIMLQQVFFDLFKNSIEAMPKGGEIAVTTQLEKDPVNDRITHVIVKVKDVGEGIPEDIRSSVFDPFFTTKEPGIGTGLGLSVVSLIMQRHNASITFESQLGTGTTFILKFPVSQARETMK